MALCRDALDVADGFSVSVWSGKGVLRMAPMLLLVFTASAVAGWVDHKIGAAPDG